MSAAPPSRWPLLLRADWPRFFRRCPKTHRERRWWGCLLAANRRIFLVHALGFGLAISVLLARCAGTRRHILHLG